MWNENRFERSQFYRGAATSEANAIFIVGCGRSGTTLLRAMLERHPNLWGGPESWLFVQPVDPVIYAWKFQRPLEEARELLATCSTAVEFAERYFGRCAADAGKTRWVEKTPRHVQCLHYLLSSFPNARFIHMVRDGRDVACSLRNHPKAAITRRGPVPIKVSKPISQCIERWRADTSAGLALAEHPRVLTLRYEALVTEPERAVRAACQFIGEPYLPELLEPRPESAAQDSALAPSNTQSFEAVNARSVGRWRSDLSTTEIQDCIRIGGPLLEALGYLATPSTATR